MYLKQKDIFSGMNLDLVRKIMEVAVTESCEGGDWVFHAGDPATTFYILLKGRVKLILGETGHAVYVVNNAGEAFGWSSLIGRKNFSASAECMIPTKLLGFDREKLQPILENDPANSMILYKRLAAILGNRLLQSYTIISSASPTEISLVYGTGQVLASPEPESE